MKQLSKLISISALISVVASLLFSANSFAAGTNSVFIIPVKGEVGPALSEFVTSNLAKANESGAKTVILEIDTLGGRIDNTLEIKDAINDTINKGIEVISFVNDEAQSAGVMLTMLGQKVAMVPGSSMGSAEVRPFDEKINSAWTGELKAVAEARGRDGNLVAAMADKDIMINNIKEKGKLLNVSAKQAKELGLCDTIVNNKQELLEFYGLKDMTIVEIQQDFKTKIASALSGRYLGPILLILGIIAIILEVFTPSFGILGTVGVLSLSTYFAGSILAGRSGWGAAILFIAGILLIGIEAYIPGFGAAGIGGLAALSAGIVFSAGDIVSGLWLLLLVLVILIVTLWLLLKYMPKTGIFEKIVLSTQMKSELGYVSSAVENELVGREGIAATVLRPAGKAEIAGRRIDVTTEGDFISKGTAIKVVKVEGSKVTVKVL
ncbi:hypothetical protein OXPF_22840 [Oxobacter pfennigii]|uniref:Uncharacterized protein n=1 Tax=Oxobacter pfennigii TaxID=36849 RepID=A0A0P8W7V5_9CLOT|nr:NfeD family protein [Oxobacter pfennigii]KPU44117.1 hypothetical protein OXPF_22840 [Oxobacter pfennigii]